MGFRLPWLLLLQSGALDLRLNSCGPEFTCSAACGSFPNQGSNPCPLHWQPDSWPLDYQGSLVTITFNHFNDVSITKDTCLKYTLWKMLTLHIQWNHHHSQDTCCSQKLLKPFCHLSSLPPTSPHPLLSPGNHWSTFCYYTLTCTL